MLNVLSEIALRFCAFRNGHWIFYFFSLPKILFCAVADSLYSLQAPHSTQYTKLHTHSVLVNNLSEAFLYWLVLTVRFVFILAKISFYMLQISLFWRSRVTRERKFVILVECFRLCFQ